MTQYVEWLRGLAAKGGKGVVNNIDARCLGRIADELERLREAAQNTIAMIENCAGVPTQPDSLPQMVKAGLARALEQRGDEK